MMTKEIIRTDGAPAPSGQYSQAVKLGSIVYVAGTCPFRIGTKEVLAPGDIAEQTKIVLRYMDAILQAAGSSLEHVVKVTAFITDLDAFDAYNEAYSGFFRIDPPARSTVEIVKLPPGMCVEIECVAYCP